MYSSDARWAELILSQPRVLAALLFGCLVAGAVALAVAQWLGWRRAPAALAACGLVLAVAVTLARPGVLAVSLGHPSCVPNEFSLTDPLERLNFLMLVPFAFFATLATRRPLGVLLVSGFFSGGVEVVQAVTDVGVCEAQDFYNNTIGAILAVVVAWLLNWAVSDGTRLRQATDSRS
jgi:hypothetical protein